MSAPTMSQLIQGVLDAATTPLTAKEIAAALPALQAASVVATVSELARTRKINRVHSPDGILRYNAGPVTAPAAQPEVARVLRPDPVPSPVVDVPAASHHQTPGDRAQSEESARTASLQGKVRAVVEAAPTQRWTLDAIESAVIARWPEVAKSAAGHVRSRIGNLTRCGDASPLRRMPDGTWMANTPENRARGQREAKAIEAIVDNAIDSPAGICVGIGIDVPAAVAAIDRQEPQAQPSASPARIEHADRSALRALICAVVMHVDQLPDPVLREISRGLDTLGTQAA
jgi:hypothetical protein